jgi:hypothetical protein
MNEAKLNELISHYEALCEQDLSPLNDFPSLRARTLLSELEAEIKHLKELLKTPSVFKATFQARAHIRAQNQDRFASFEAIPQSPTNQMYWDIAMEVFAPKTLGELLTYLSPNTQRFVVAQINDAPITLNAQDQGELQQKLRTLHNDPPLLLEERAFTPQDFPEAPSKERMAELILVEGCLFDVARISQFPLKSNSDLLKVLETQRPKLLSKLVNHNEAMQSLKADVEVFRNNVFTPKEAFTALCKGLRLGGERMTGHEYASGPADAAVKHFFEYFLALPQALQTEIKALKGDNKSMEQVFNEDLDKGHCVETCANDIERIVQANPDSSVLNNHPRLSKEERRFPNKRYKQARDCAQNPDFISIEDLPKQHLLLTLSKLRLNTSRELIVLLVHFPPELYELILGRVDLIYWLIILAELGAALSSGLFTPEQRTGLAQALAKLSQRFTIESLYQDYEFNDWAFIATLCAAIPQPQRLALLETPDGEGRTVLHRATEDPQAFIKLLNFYPEGERLAALRLKTEAGSRVLHWAGGHVESLRAVLNEYPKEEQLSALMEQDDNASSVLHWSGASPQSLSLILSLYPEHQRLDALNQKNEEDQTVVQEAAQNIESLKAILNQIPEKSRIDVLKTKVTKSQCVCDKLADATLELEDSFAPTYIRLHRLLNTPSTAESSSSFFTHPLTTSLANRFKSAQTFDEVKQLLIDFLFEHRHQSLHLSHQLWALLAPKTDKNLDALRAQWSMPAQDPNLNRLGVG